MVSQACLLMLLWHLFFPLSFGELQTHLFLYPLVAEVFSLFHCDQLHVGLQRNVLTSDETQLLSFQYIFYSFVCSLECCLCFYDSLLFALLNLDYFFCSTDCFYFHLFPLKRLQHILS